MSAQEALGLLQSSLQSTATRSSGQGPERSLEGPEVTEISQSGRFSVYVLHSSTGEWENHYL